MQRNNELLPQLSAGIPTRRIIRPVLMGAAFTLSFGTLNQEFVIPEIADELLTPKDDPEGGKAQPVMGAFDRDGLHFEGIAGFRRDRVIRYVYITFPDTAASGMFHLVADEATYIPPGDGPLTGGWLLKQATPETPEAARIPADRMPTNLTLLDPGRYFLKTEDIDFDTVSRGVGWIMFASTPKLREMLTRPEPQRQSKIAVMFHMRFTRPAVGALLLVFGLSVILRDPNRHVFISAGLCLVFSAWFYSFVLACKYLGDNDYVAAPLAAWLPVLVFGPITLVSFDSIHT